MTRACDQHQHTSRLTPTAKVKAAAICTTWHTYWASLMEEYTPLTLEMAAMPARWTMVTFQRISCMQNVHLATGQLAALCCANKTLNDLASGQPAGEDHQLWHQALQTAAGPWNHPSSLLRSKKKSKETATQEGGLFKPVLQSFLVRISVLPSFFKGNLDPRWKKVSI